MSLMLHISIQLAEGVWVWVPGVVINTLSPDVAGVTPHITSAMGGLALINIGPS